MLPARPVLAAFTATATAAVKDDIVRLIGLHNPVSLTTGFDRPNLYFSVEQPKDKTAWIKAYLSGQIGKSGIIYCATRKTVEELCAELQYEGFSATRYHAGLEDAERRQNQDAFAFDRKTVMVATNAFGMGIDKSNVGFVIHYNMPKNIDMAAKQPETMPQFLQVSGVGSHKAEQYGTIFMNEMKAWKQKS